MPYQQRLGIVWRLRGPLRSSCLPPRDGALLGHIGTAVRGRCDQPREADAIQ